MNRAILLTALLLILAPPIRADDATQSSHLIEVRITGVGVTLPIAGEATVDIDNQSQVQTWSADPLRPIQARFAFAISSLVNESLAINISAANGTQLLSVSGQLTPSDIHVDDSYVSPDVRLDQNASSLLVVTSPVQGLLRAEVVYRNATTAPAYPAQLLLDVPSANDSQTVVNLSLHGTVATAQVNLTSSPATMTFALVVAGPDGPIYTQNGTMDWVTGGIVVRSPGADDTKADSVLVETSFDPSRSSGGTGLSLPNNVLTRSARVAQLTEPRAPVGTTTRIGAPPPAEPSHTSENQTNESFGPQQAAVTPAVPTPIEKTALPADPRSTSNVTKTLAIIGATAAVISASAAVGTFVLRARAKRRRAEYDQRFTREVLGR